MISIKLVRNAPKITLTRHLLSLRERLRVRGLNSENICFSFLKSWKHVFAVALFVQLNLFIAPVFACDAPANRFCVDFFKGTNLKGKPLYTGKAPYIKYNWAKRSPARGVAKDNFSARWRGLFDFKAGQYEFRALADDGVRVMLDGQLILDHWQDGKATEYLVEVNPGAGTHLVEVEYFEATGNAQVQVAWKQLTTSSPLVIAPKETVTVDKVVPTTPSSVINTVEPVTTTAQTITTQPANTTASTSAVTASSTTTVEALAIKAATLKSKPVKNPVIKAPNPNVNKAPIGVNLSAFSYFSSSVPFKDLLMQTNEVKVVKQDSNDPCPDQPSFTLEGLPSSLPSGCLISIWSVFHIPATDLWPSGTPAYQLGHYVLLHQGQGKIRLGWDAKNVTYKGQGRIEFDVPTPKDGISVVITAMEWNDPIRDIHIVHIDDESTFREQPFNEKWLALLKPFKVLRFMDWGAVSLNQSVYFSPAVSHTSQTVTLPESAPAKDNTFANMVAVINVDGKWPRVLIESYDGASRTLRLKTPIDISVSGKQPTVNIYDFLNRTWPERALPTTFGQTSAKGIAFETMIKLANTLGADPWITIPTAADDKFVEALAVLLKKELNPRLKCYIEYSNETWNFGYPGYNYAEAKARELNLSGALLPADAWQAYRAIEIFKLFNRVFGEADLKQARSKSRLIRVLTSQTAYFDRAKKVMDWMMPGSLGPTQGLPAYKYADAWAVTTYFYLDKDISLESSSIEQLLDTQLDSINAMFGDSNNPGIIRNLLTESKNRGMQLVVYEGGTHVLPPSNNTELVAKIAQLNDDPRIKEVYSKLLKSWDNLYKEFGESSVGVLNHYSDISRYGKYGYWGLLQSTYQNPETAPRYQVIKDYVSAP